MCRTVCPPNGCIVCQPLFQVIDLVKTAKENHRLARGVPGDGPVTEEATVDASIDQLICIFGSLEIGNLPQLEPERGLSLSAEYRQEQVEKFVRVVLPHPQVPQSDPRIRALLAYVKRVECDFYRRATSIQEYERLWREKIVKTQNGVQELQEIRRREKNRFYVSFNRISL